LLAGIAGGILINANPGQRHDQERATASTGAN
jgi:hypothetical protein